MLCLLAWFYILYRGTTSFINLADITITQIPRSVVKVTVYDWLLSLVRFTRYDTFSQGTEQQTQLTGIVRPNTVLPGFIDFKAGQSI